MIGTLSASTPELAILVLTVASSELQILAALRAGARGYLFEEDMSRLRRALDEVLAGESPMSAGVAKLVLLQLRTETPAVPGCEPQGKLTAREIAGAATVTIASQVRFAVLRIFQEAVHEAVKHAAPGRICARLALIGDDLELEVTDDGRGFTSESVAPGRGVPGMRARAAELGGHARSRARHAAPSCGSSSPQRFARALITAGLRTFGLRMVVRYRSMLDFSRVAQAMPSRRLLYAVYLSAIVLGVGCAGAFGGYGPGMTNLDRTSTGCVQDGPMTATCSSNSYNSGERSYGAQIGARAGVVSATAGTLGSGTGLAIDAHADFTVAMNNWGAGLEFGYTNDQPGGDAKLFYWGIPVIAYGQYALTSRIFVHLGGGRVLHGVVSQDSKSADASAWRAVAGITFVFARNEKRDFALRFEARAQKSGDAMINGQDASWSSTAMLAEIVWATY